MAAVRIDGNNLKYASKRLRDHDMVVLEAIKNKAEAFKHASFRLRSDYNFIRRAIEENYDAYHYMKPSLKYRHTLLYNKLINEDILKKFIS